MEKISFILSLFFVMIYTPCWATMEVDGSTNHCHCFKERTFNPQKKYAADEYLLTTCFNSFLAASFKISKTQIVMTKMKDGVDSDDLVIALYVARAGKVELKMVLADIKSGRSWQKIIESKRLNKAGKDGVESVLVDAGANKKEMADSISDQLVKEFFAVSEDDINVLRSKGVSSREVTLLFNLEQNGKTGKTAEDILAIYRQQNKSWGEIVHSFGLTPKETGVLLLPEGASGGSPM